MTLTEITYYTRRSAPFVLLGMVFFVLFYFIIRLVFVQLAAKKTLPPPVYNTLFGKLNKINFSSQIDYPPEATFTLDTIEGRPITATDGAKIFFLPKKVARFGYLQTAYLMAKTLDFNTTIIKHQLDGTNIVFDDGEKRLSVDITNFNFEYKLNYENSLELFDDSVLPDEKTIVENAKQFLRALNKYPEELTLGNQEIIYLNFDSITRDFAVVSSPEEANVVEVDFYRPDIDTFPVRPPRYFNSQNFVVMAFKNDNYKVIKAQVKFFEPDTKNYATYPVKTGEEAYAQLKKGKGVIVSSGLNTNQITITKMLLGYYDPDVYQPYLQPIYIFLGENGFAAYVPAVRDDFIED